MYVCVPVCVYLCELTCILVHDYSSVWGENA